MRSGLGIATVLVGLSSLAGCTAGVYDDLDFTDAITLTPLFSSSDLLVQVTQNTKFRYQLTNTLAVEAKLEASPSFSAPYSYSGGSWPGTAGTCGSTLASKASCYVELQFSPTARGAASASGSIRYLIQQSGKKDANAAVKLEPTGSGLIPGVFAASATSVAFGKTSAYSPYQYVDKTVTLTNNGDYTLINTSFAGITAPFSPSGTCGATLAPAASCTLSVRFQPGAGSTTYGPTAYTITYNDGAPVSQNLTLNLTFTGERDDTAPNTGAVSWNAVQLDPAGAGGPPSISSDSTPVLSGSAEADAIISIYDGAADCGADSNKLGEATVQSGGSFTVSNITVSTEKTYSFWYRIKDSVLNPAACTNTGQQFQYVAKPSAPANFRTTATSPFAIALAWNDVSNEDAYEFQSCSGAGCTNLNAPIIMV